MATYSEDVYNIYSIYRSTFPLVKVDAANEDSILASIDKALTDKAYLIPNANLMSLVLTYKTNLEKASGKLGSSGGGFASEISGRISAFFRTAIPSIWSGFWEKVEIFFDTTLVKGFNKFVAADEKAFSNTMKGFVDGGFVSQESADYLLSVFAKAKISSGLAPAVIVTGIILTLVFQSTGLMMGDYVKMLKSKFTPEQLGPGDLIRAMHVAPELSEEINKKLRETGLAEDDIKLAKIAGYQTYDITTVMQCFLREIITQDEAVNRLEELGFTPVRIKEIMSTWELIPSPQDLFWMVGKEAFETDQIKTFGLDDEFPTEQVKWLKMQGYSEYWSKKYWAAHWDYPSEGRVLELYHRGIIDDKDLDSFYRVIEMPTYWREKLKKASYSLYTRVDLRRMHDSGIITEDDVYTNFRAEGYDEKHARNMTDFYIKYNEVNDKDLSLSQIRNAYEADVITKKQATDALLKLQYSQAQADFIIEYVEYDEMIKIQKLRIKSIANMFKHNLYDKAKTKSMLSSLGVELKWIDVYLVQWEEEKLHEEKMPDKNELLSWYSSGTIDVETMTEYLRRMGYSDETILIYIKASKPS